MGAPHVIAPTNLCLGSLPELIPRPVPAGNMPRPADAPPAHLLRVQLHFSGPEEIFLPAG